MPRIKRWFPVSHDINSDPEIWEMRRSIGEKSLSIWLEILSIGDRNGGELSGRYEELTRSIAGKCQATTRTVTAVFDFAKSKLWVESQPTLRVSNFLKYHRTEERKETPQGIKNCSPPNQTEPNQTEPSIKKKSKIRLAPPLEAVELAQLLSDKIFENIPDRTPPTESQLMAWADEADRIYRIDGHPWDKIRELLLWSQRDEFWKANILSMSKLRKQWNQLVARANGAGQSKADRLRHQTAQALKRGIP